MNSLRSRFPLTGRTVTLGMRGTVVETSRPRLRRAWEPFAMAETTRAPVDVFERARTHERKEQLEAVKEADLRPYRHNQMDKLEKMLGRGVSDGGGVLVVVDGVFSMEGDLCPVPDGLELTERYGVRLMVDEAHAVGVLGETGAGSCELFGVAD